MLPLAIPERLIPPERVLETLSALNAQARARATRERRRRLRVRIVFLLLGVVVVTLLAAVDVAVWDGALDIRLGAAPRLGGRQTSTSPSPHREESRQESYGRAGSSPAAWRQRPSRSVHVQAVSIQLTASHGDCWILIRDRDASGPILYSGVLKKSESIRMRGSRLWIRLGASGNVELQLDGKPVQLAHTGTVDAVASSHGIQS